MFVVTFYHTKPRQGFTLIEMAIVLGIVGILSAGLWRLMSVGTQQSKDLAAAQQQTALINAVQGYLADTSVHGGQAWMKTLGQDVPTALGLPTSNNSLTDCQNHIGLNFYALCSYLPNGFTKGTTNPYGQNFNVNVRVDSIDGSGNPVTYSFMIVTTGGSIIPDADGGRISSLIGGDGGFVYTSAVCTNGNPSQVIACGTMGAWQITITNPGGNGYGYNPGNYSGDVASRTYIPAPVGGSNAWLARIVIPGDTTTYYYNTMTTNMFFSAGDFYMYPAAGGAPNPTGTESIHLNDGALDIDGTGEVNLETAGEILGAGTNAASAPEIFLTATTAYMEGATPNPLVKLAAGCSKIFVVAPVTCQSALDVTSGDITVGGEVLAIKILSTSDARLKTNIRPIKEPLNDLMKIDPVAFALKDSGAESMGVTAQNLEKVYPQLVTEVNGKKYVEYNGLIGPLIGAVQELKRQNDDLRQQLDQQKLREDRLEKDVGKKISP